MFILEAKKLKAYFDHLKAFLKLILVILSISYCRINCKTFGNFLYLSKNYSFGEQISKVQPFKNQLKYFFKTHGFQGHIRRDCSRFW
jgi:hypothetical protein